LPQVAAIGLHQGVAVGGNEFLLLVLRQAARMRTEHEAGDARKVEIVLQQLAEAGGALGGRHRGPKHLDRLRAEIGDKGAGVLRGRADRERSQPDEGEQGNRNRPKIAKVNFWHDLFLHDLAPGKDYSIMSDQRLPTPIVSVNRRFEPLFNFLFNL
jgi:hypothetical protein